MQEERRQMPELNTKSPSPFTCSRKVRINGHKKNGTYTQKKLPGENLVIRALFEYAVLTRQLIQQNLAVYGHERIDTDRVLKNLIDKKMVSRFTIKGDEQLDVYMLTNRALKKEYGHLIKRPRKASDIMENLALAQYQLSAMMSENVRNIMFYDTAEKDGVEITIPSLIKIRNRAPLFISALPSPRLLSDEKMSAFYKKLALLDAFFKENQHIYRTYMHLIVCKSMTEANELSEMLCSSPYTKDMLLLYTTDRECQFNEENKSCLSSLRFIKRLDNENETRIVDLTNRYSM